METSLHRELKAYYAGDEAQTEVRLGGYRIDAIVRGELVEIQHGSLAAVRDKVRALVRKHRVRVVKPIVATKMLIKRQRKGGRVTDERLSPKRGSLWDLFDELVYFTRAFPHPRLTLDVVLVDVEEWRYPGHGRRRRYRPNDFQVEDRKLKAVRSVHSFSTTEDLRRLLPDDLPQPFHTGDLTRAIGVSRGVAQRIAYCLREMGASLSAGKRGNFRLYTFAA